ncbi:AAA family ATPase [Maridesulfovibrio sp.]|uniref:AAA family ATPase n=1 Tax=Maridesulfovibrio sp. TaxID=2795000 RepID=UPI003BAA4530
MQLIYDASNIIYGRQNACYAARSAPSIDTLGSYARRSFLYSLILSVICLFSVLLCLPENARAVDSGDKPSWYTVQLGTYSTADIAQENYNDFIKKFPALTDNLRIEKISDLYPLRVGAFSKKAKADEVFAKVKNFNSGVFILRANIPKNRLVYPLASSPIPQKSAAQKETTEKPNTLASVPAQDKIFFSSAIHTETIAPDDSAPMQRIPVSQKQTANHEASAGLADNAENGQAYASPSAEEAKPRPIPVRVTNRNEDNPEDSNTAHDTISTNEADGNVIGRTITEATSSGTSFSTIFKKAFLSLIVAGSIAILLYGRFWGKETKTQININDFKHDTVLETPRLMPKLELLLHQNMNQTILAEESFLAAENKIYSIYITSPAKREGKTTVALNLAYTMAKGSNNSVLLIDGCVEKPELHQLLGVGKVPGLVDVMEGTAKLKNTILKTSYQNLDFLPLGGHDCCGGKLNNLEKFGRLLTVLKKHYRYIIIDGASMWGTTRTAIIVSCFDGVLISVEAERTRWEIVQFCREKIQRVNGNVLGVVLTKRNFYIPRFLYGKL